ncbi:MAG TPA: hypothetical protein PLY68_08055 [Myxococcota bacterium]|nr:hypothetical protein [Myxococcota bacterium]HQP96127.1 hypothetical protein [Myxococcota bacterium]
MNMIISAARFTLAGVLIALCIIGCGDEVPPADVIQDVVTDTTEADTTETDTTETDTTETDASGGEFVIRKPSQEALSCSMMGGDPYYITQLDFVCRMNNDALNADLYIQTTPIDCGEWGNPSYKTDAIWLKMGDTINATTGSYEFGGRHHNDMISFMYNGSRHILWHSSIGYGWRACTTPDCLVVCEPGQECVVDTTDGVATDGCARKAGDPPPPLPVICVQVDSNGNVPDFLDPWTTDDPLNETPGAMILPCLGEETMEL